MSTAIVKSVYKVHHQKIKEKKLMSTILNQILNNINAGLIAVDTRLNVVLSNSFAEKIIHSNINGKSRHSTILKTNENIKKALAKTLETNTGQQAVMSELTTDKSEKIPVLYNTALLKNQVGETEGAIYYFRPLPELLNSDTEWDEELFKPTLEDVAADIAHEIRNPLGGIIGFASLLEQDLANNPASQTMVQKIIQGANGLEGIVSNLTIVSRHRPKLDSRPVSFRTILEAYCDKFQKYISGRNLEIHLVQNYPETEFTVSLAPNIFYQMLDIIFQYYLKILAEEGNIYLTLEYGSSEKSAILNLHAQSVYSEDEKLENISYENKKMLPYLRHLALQRIVIEHKGQINFLFDDQRNPVISIELPIVNM